MPETKTISLLKPFEHHGVTIETVEIKEPSGALYAQLGEPRVAVRTGEGGYWVEQPDVIKRYLDKLIVHQDGAVLLSLMSMADVMLLKDSLFGFFTDAEAVTIARRVPGSPLN